MAEAAARSQLEEMERDRLSVYVAHARVPWWYWPFVGLTTGLMLAASDLSHPLATVLAVAAYAFVVTLVLSRVASEAGVLVRMRGMPGTLRRPLVAYMLAAGLVVLGGMTTTLFLPVPWSFVHVGAAVGLVLWLGGWWAFRVYESRAERLARAAGIRR